MRSSVFSDILDRLDSGAVADLRLQVSDRTVVRRFIPPDRLILLGGGHVSLALSRIAVPVGFEVIVADDRPIFANAERFPTATRVICDSFENAIHDIGIRSSDYVCVLTRGHRWDRQCVCQLLDGVMPSYLGMIGSRRRVIGMKESLIEDGYTEQQLAALHAPIGLPIGAVTPEEIAVSIVAELIQHRSTLPSDLPDGTLDMMNTDEELLRFLSDSDEPRVMLCVLSSSGSTPAKSGAMMATDLSGRTFGTIGGGCSEAAAIGRARRMIGTGERRIIEIDMSNDVAAENGMVCGGTMTVLIEDIC